jgi:hypothetical protein
LILFSEDGRFSGRETFRIVFTVFKLNAFPFLSIKFTRIGGTIFYNTDEINKLLSSGYVNKNPN